LDLPPIRPKFTLLDPDDCLRIHQATCRILRETGVRVFSAAGQELLRAAGAVVEGDLVRIPPSLVEWALASAPRGFSLYKRGSAEACLHLDGSRVYFGPGSDTLRYLDPRSGERRAFFLSDIADCMRVCDGLPEIGFVMSVGVPGDVPSESAYRHQFATMLRNTTKPVVFVCDGLADIQAISEMAAAVAGGMDRLSRYPNILLYSEPSTPLQHSREATEKLLFCAEHSLPVTHSPAPMMGGTAPATIAGAVALGSAEMLSGLVMHQLKNPGAPFLFGHGVHHLDMRTMVSVYGAPEFQLARVLAAEMGRFYGLPVWGYAGHSDSKVIDGQAAIDMQFSVSVALLAGTHLNHDIGYLESGLTNSPEMMVLANEVIAMNRRFVEGIRIDSESLAVDVVHQVGPGGEFMSHDHTLEHFREFWTPRIFDRSQLDRWEEQGSKDLNARLREATLALMDQHEAIPLPEDIDQEIDRILSSQ
jgi:trimethylamine--corrinoid protein Co-methyltransferase